jgi:transposase-like protein
MGRKQKRTVAAAWRDRLARFRRGKMTVVEFCRREGVSSPSFYQWRKRLKQDARETFGRSGEGPPSNDSDRAHPFVPLALLSPVAEVELPNGIRIRVPAADTHALHAAVLAAKEACQGEDVSC